MRVRKLNESKLNEKYKHINSLCAGDIIDDDGTQRTVKSIEDKSKFIQVKFEDGTSSNYDANEQVKVMNECMRKSKRITETASGKDELDLYLNNTEYAYRRLADIVKRGVEKGYSRNAIVAGVRKAIAEMKDDFGRIPTTQQERAEIARDFVEDELSGTDYDLTEAFKIGADERQFVRVVNPYNYTIQELRIDNAKKTFERGNFGWHSDKKTKNRQEYEDVVDKLKEMGYTEIPSDYRSLRNKTRKGVPTNENKSIKETYWIDNKEVMTEVDRLEKELEHLGWKRYDDKYTGSKYYTIFGKRDENGKGMFKAVKYGHTHTPEIVDLTYKQITGDEPLDSFDGLRKKLGKALLPTNEDLDHYSHFKFTSGANPYIAKTSREANRLIKKYGDKCKFQNNIRGIDYYTVDDNVSDLFMSEDVDEVINVGDIIDVPYSNKSGRVLNIKGDVVTVEIYGGKDPDRIDTFYYSEIKKFNESADEDTPYTKAEINKEIKALTNNFTANDGVARTAFEREKNYAIDILSKHYKNVEVSGDEYNDYRIAYDTPLKNLNEDSNDVLTLSEIPDNRKWQYSIAGRDVPYTEYEDAKKHFKDEFNITDYRDELQKYLDKETDSDNYFFVDETFDGRLVVSVSYGDWKHDHLYLDNLVRNFFLKKGLDVEREEEVTSDTDEDVYSSDHYYELSDFVLSGRPIKESYKKGDRVQLDSGATGTVHKDFDWKNEDQVAVKLDDTNEIKYVLYDTLHELRESLLQDIKRDRNNIKATWGNEVDKALTDYIHETDNDLGKVMYSEKEWKKFEKWAKKKGVKFNKKDDSFENQLGESYMKLNEDFSDVDRENLKVEIMDAISNFVIDKYGDEEWMEYVVVEVVPADNNSIKVEVRTEFGYKTITALSNKLDEIIRRYDRYAYFEPETYGIISAYIMDRDKSQYEVDKEMLNSFKKIINDLNTPDECRDFYVKEIKPLGDSSYVSEATYDAIGDYLIDRFDALESKQANEGLNEASYGGAYDIEDDQYFTKDDIVEFADNVAEKVNNNTGKAFKVTDVNMDTPTKLYVELEDAEHGTISTQIKIDFRKVRKPSDLVKVYVDNTADKLISMI